jgi:hypothetical protein
MTYWTTGIPQGKEPVRQECDTLGAAISLAVQWLEAGHQGVQVTHGETTISALAIREIYELVRKGALRA